MTICYRESPDSLHATWHDTKILVTDNRTTNYGVCNGYADMHAYEHREHDTFPPYHGHLR
jgi:hypothetical protein